MSTDSVSIEKLHGSDNYFAMENVLQLNGLGDCISAENEEKDANKVKKALARIVLNIDTSIYIHIEIRQRINA